VEKIPQSGALRIRSHIHSYMRIVDGDQVVYSNIHIRVCCRLPVGSGLLVSIIPTMPYMCNANSVRIIRIPPIIRTIDGPVQSR